MSQNTDRLTTMVKVAPDQVASVEGSIAQVEDSIESLEKEESAIEDGVCGNAETDMTTYLQGPKLTEIQITNPTAYLVFGGTYGSIAWSDPGPVGNITDWEYRVDLPIPPPPAPPPVPPYTVVYSYTPGDDTTIDDLVADYAFGNDYLTRSLTSGASYGIKPKIASLQSAANLLNENADKIGDSVAVFNKYAT